VNEAEAANICKFIKANGRYEIFIRGWPDGSTRDVMTMNVAPGIHRSKASLWSDVMSCLK